MYTIIALAKCSLKTIIHYPLRPILSVVTGFRVQHLIIRLLLLLLDNKT
jgi:hypothetical protein